MTDDEKFMQIKLDLIKLLVNMEDTQKKNNILLQLDVIIKRVNNANRLRFN